MEEPSTSSARVYLELELRPHRSLSHAGFVVLISAVAIVSFVAGVIWVMRGAWPVTGFFGLDALLLYLAFRTSYRQTRAGELVRVTAEHVDVLRRTWRGRESNERLATYWTRVKFDDPPQHASQIELASRGRTLVIGSFLPPEERAGVAEALTTALEAARGERFEGA